MLGTLQTPTRPMFDLTGLVALVTGGGRGIGRACARALAQQGAAVAIVAWAHPQAADDTAAQLRKMGARARVLVANVADPESATYLVRRVVDDMGRLDIVVNNAGIASSADLLTMGPAEWDDLLAVDLKAHFLVAQAAAREMIRAGHGGRIISVSSPGPGGGPAPHASAATGGVEGLTRTMALQLAPHGITVNVVTPGLVETDMAAELLKDALKHDAALARIPLRRAARTEEVASAVAFLASPEASYCTGSTLLIDGGWRLG